MIFWIDQNEKTGCVKPKIGSLIVPEMKRKLKKINDENRLFGCDENLMKKI